MRDAKLVQAISCQISRKAPNVQEPPLSTGSPSKHERTTDEGDNAHKVNTTRRSAEQSQNFAAVAGIGNAYGAGQEGKVQKQAD